MMPAHTGPAMHALIRLFIDIALHRKGPQDIPAGGAMLGLALCAYLAFGAASLWPTAAGTGLLAGQLALDLVLVVLVFGGLLAVTGRAARVPQTLAALLGTGALLSAVALPFVWLAAAGMGEEVGDAAGAGLALFGATGLFVLLIASLLVTGHIVRQAMDWPYAGGVLAAVVYFSLSVSVFRNVFPVS